MFSNPYGDRIWHKRAFCKCGWSGYCPFGDLFHLHIDVCPKCGKSKNIMKVKSARLISYPKKGFWNKFFGIKYSEFEKID